MKARRLCGLSVRSEGFFMSDIAVRCGVSVGDIPNGAARSHISLYRAVFIPE